MPEFNHDIDESVLYPPTEEFRSQAHVKSMEEYERMYKSSIEEPEKFWGDMARELYWQIPFAEVGPRYNLDMDKGPVKIEWFMGGKTNLAYNCLDRNIKAGLGSKVALYYEGNDEDDHHKAFTYQEVYDMVCKMANALKASGVKKGDRVTIYLPMIAELPVTMLACARIGAIHCVVFGGFSAEALAGRLTDASSEILVTADGVMRGPKPVLLKVIADKAVEIAEKKNTLKVNKVVCVKRTGGTKLQEQVKHEWHADRDVWFDEFIKEQPSECECEWMDSEDPLFMLYTSGSTGKPKGVVHSTGGYMLGAYASTKYAFDYQPQDVFFCTADCGWITGHTYITYGPMLNAATQVLFEGVPNHPGVDRFWAICAKYKVTSFYTAPTVIRSLMKFGDEPVKKHDLSSLKILASVGEPINPAAWQWYRDVVGGGHVPITDTYWQTESGSHLIAPLCGAHSLKPGSACFPIFGVQVAILDDKGNELEGPCNGYLVIKNAPPSLMRTVFGDQDRFEKAYFSQFKGYFVTGDGCRRDKDGFYWITGRMDDVINVSGHRIGTAEVESALVAHPSVSEAAVVGFPHNVKGEGIYCYVTLKEGLDYTDDLKPQLKAKVREVIGAFATPDNIHWAPGLPKTRSGKIMRRVLRKLALPTYETEDLGDTSTLADPSIVDVLKSYHPLAKTS
eukprot:TRINITY_DN56442_c1_g1_i1.p1 TRINITY_DN56442_c1_g1~~TRINITY_DN56442_c1_g1_i1.p1  ORF type:complete len:677 (+),score=136.52 TRINITY_DN56442_c1_g1_i1:205-2235(+)